MIDDRFLARPSFLNTSYGNAPTFLQEGERSVEQYAQKLQEDLKGLADRSLVKGDPKRAEDARSQLSLSHVQDRHAIDMPTYIGWELQCGQLATCPFGKRLGRSLS